MPRADDELLAAYLDGVAELSPDERRRVEHALEADPAARAEAEATRGLLAELRGLPAAGREPDWASLERSIDAAVGPTVPRPWWRAWRWLVPVGALAATAAVAVVVFHRAPERETAPAPHVIATPAAEQPAPANTLWLDGEALDVSNVDAEALLDDLDHDARAALATDDDEGSINLLPLDDLGWVDALDDRGAEKAEAALARLGKKS